MAGASVFKTSGRRRARADGHAAARDAHPSPPSDDGAPTKRSRHAGVLLSREWSRERGETPTKQVSEGSHPALATGESRTPRGAGGVLLAPAPPTHTDLSLDTQSAVPDGVFSACVMLGVLEFVRDPRATFRRVARALQPGGERYISSHYITTHHHYINHITPHYITLHCIALHCIVLHCIALHCIALHCIALHCIAYTLHCICIALHMHMHMHCIAYALYCICILLHMQCIAYALHYIAHCTLHIAHCTLHIAHCTLHIAHCTLHAAAGR